MCLPVRIITSQLISSNRFTRILIGEFDQLMVNPKFAAMMDTFNKGKEDMKTSSVSNADGTAAANGDNKNEKKKKSKPKPQRQTQAEATKLVEAEEVIMITQQTTNKNSPPI
jgi:hypothetical protein